MKMSAVLVLSTGLLLAPQIQAACDKGAILTERAYKEAITAEIKKNRTWSTYAIDRFGSTKNEYQVTLRKGLDVIELTYEAVESDNCQVEVKLLDEQVKPSPKKK